VIILAVALAGVLAGAIHVLAGADHLAAVAPLAAAGRRQGWRAGLRWGMGHAGGVTIVALVAFGLREVVPLENISSWSERVVGVTLIGIGVWALTGSIRTLRHRALPDHEHEHVHAPGDTDDADTPHGHAHVHRNAHGGVSQPHAHVHRHGRHSAALFVGLLHGTAGGSHVLGVIPALALPTRAAALGYLAGFGAGTVAAMTLFASLVGLASLRFALAGPRAWAGLLGGCGATSIAVGVFWLAV
jgi:ABC-type nickel/cobalt efflux system permease component RcnA